MAVHPKSDFPKNLTFAKADYTDVRTARKVTKEEAFQIACMDKGVEPTIRQARKYLGGRNRWA